MEHKNSHKKLLSQIFKALFYIVTIFVCLIVFFLLYYIFSSQLHANDEDYKPFISVYTIVSPSMTPVINVYDVVVNVRVDNPQNIEPGDIITYKSAASNSEGMTITHRVVEISKLPDGTYEYMTQGDNNKEPDPLYVTFDNVIGKEIVIIPFIGRIQFLIANQKGWLALLLIPILIYLFIEVFKLTDLFNLRKKVDKILKPDDNNHDEESKRYLEQERKEYLKELLSNRPLPNPYEKNFEETESFLEKYTETIVDVNENKYKNILKPTKTIKLGKSEELFNKITLKDVFPSFIESSNEKQSSLEDEIQLNKAHNNTIEVLDTDELTSKIKEYDEKITKLNQLLNKVELEEKEKITPSYEEKDNYLVESKIKVLEIVPAKDYQAPNKIKLGFVSQQELHNSRKTVTRPKSEDISTLRKETLNTSPKKQSKNLNLNPHNIKKINRPNKNNSKKARPNLNLNPRKIKKVSRPNYKRKRPPLIVIEKRQRKK